MDLKAARQRKGSNWVFFNVPDEPFIKATHAVEEGVVKLLNRHP